MAKHFPYLFGQGHSSIKAAKFSESLSDFGWYPQLYDAAGGDFFKLKEIENQNLWEVMTFLNYQRAHNQATAMQE